ncbi:hypothetical protein DSECCO2_433720 [anaerobic digester metagenome]
MREHRSPGDQVTDVFILWLDFVFLLIFIAFPAFSSPDKCLEPVPAVHFQFIHVLFDLGSLECKPFGKYKAHPSPDAVRSYPFKVPVPFNLGFFSRVPVNTNRTVPDYQADFIFRRRIL